MLEDLLIAVGLKAAPLIPPDFLAASASMDEDTGSSDAAAQESVEVAPPTPASTPDPPGHVPGEHILLAEHDSRDALLEARLERFDRRLRAVEARLDIEPEERPT